MFIKLVGNKEGVYINPVTAEAVLDLEKATNYDKVSLQDANNVVVYRNHQGDFWISSVGGYSIDRGLFCDLYSKNGERWDEI